MSLEKFKSNSKNIRIHGTIAPDHTYPATASNVRVRVYDGVYDHSLLITSATVLFVLCGLTFLCFLILLIVRKTAMENNTQQRSFVTAVLLSVFFGAFGVDRFYSRLYSARDSKTPYDRRLRHLEPYRPNPDYHRQAQGCRRKRPCQVRLEPSPFCGATTTHSCCGYYGQVQRALLILRGILCVSHRESLASA